MPVDREAVLRTAERLLRQGRLEGAIAEYVRLTDDQPRDWNSINTLGDLYVRAGDTDRAVAQFVRIADHLFAEGFLPKAAALYKKALKVKHDHEHTLLRLSEIAAKQELLADAKLYLRQLAQQRQKRGDAAGAAECVVRLGTIDDADGEAKMAAARAAQDLGRVDQAVAFLQGAAAAFQKHRRADDAADALVAATQLAPDDRALRATVARTLLASGQVERAQPFLSAGSAGDDPDLLIAVARQDLIAGRVESGVAGLMRAIAFAPDRQDQVTRIGEELLAGDRPEAAYGCVEVLADAALFEGAIDRAIQQLESFLARRRMIAGLLKLVDVYVDAGLDDRITPVQEQLADAYLDNGRPVEARVVAEDLIARQPHVEQHAQRLRQALAQLGVDDIDAIVARQREVAPTFQDLLELPPPESSAIVPVAPVSQPARVTPDPELPVDVQIPSRPVTRVVAVSDRDTGEIDLSTLLANLNAGNAMSAPTHGTDPSDGRGAPDPAALFEQAQEHLRRGEAKEAALALQTAAGSPQFRFKAAAQLGRLSVSHGDFHGAVEWLERAASAPAASPDETFSAVYDLGDALERAGEHVRALAVFMELEADAGRFRDVRLRIDHLARAANGVNGDRS